MCLHSHCITWGDLTGLDLIVIVCQQLFRVIMFVLCMTAQNWMQQKAKDIDTIVLVSVLATNWLLTLTMGNTCYPCIEIWFSYNYNYCCGTSDSISYCLLKWNWHAPLLTPGATIDLAIYTSHDGNHTCHFDMASSPNFQVSFQCFDVVVSYFEEILLDMGGILLQL